MNKLLASPPSRQTIHRQDNLSRSAIQKLVCQTNLLQSLPKSACDQLLDAGRLQKILAKTRIFGQEEPANVCYVVLAGEIRLTQLTPGGKRVIIDMIGPGMHLGLFVAITGKPYPISAETIEDSTVYAWNAAVMRNFVLKMPVLTLNSLSGLCDRITQLQIKVQQLATERVEQRIAHSLLSLVQHMGETQEDGILINMPLSQRDLAEMSGTNVYSVSRVLKKWKEDGIIVVGRMHVLVRKPNRLYLLAADES